MKIRIGAQTMAFDDVQRMMPVPRARGVEDRNAIRSMRAHQLAGTRPWKMTFPNGLMPCDDAAYRSMRPLLNRRDRRRWLMAFRETCSLVGDMLDANRVVEALLLLMDATHTTLAVALDIVLRYMPGGERGRAFGFRRTGSAYNVLNVSSLPNGAQRGDWIALTLTLSGGGAPIGGVVVNLDPPQICTAGAITMRAGIAETTDGPIVPDETWIGHPVVWSAAWQSVFPWIGNDDPNGEPIGLCTAIARGARRGDDSLVSVRIGDVKTDVVRNVARWPLHDAPRVRVAMFEFARATFATQSERNGAAARILAAARRHGLDYRAFAAYVLSGFTEAVFHPADIIGVGEEIEAINRRLAAHLAMPLETLFGDRPRAYTATRDIDTSNMLVDNDVAIDPAGHAIGVGVPFFEMPTREPIEPIEMRGRYGNTILRYPASVANMTDDLDGPVTPREASGSNDGGGSA
jgi:hypothetical protein